MITGKIRHIMAELERGQCIIIDMHVLYDAAKRLRKSYFDPVTNEDVRKIVNQINSDEYPEYQIDFRIDTDDWVLMRHKNHCLNLNQLKK